MKKERKPVVVPAILRVLENGVYATGELFDVFLSGYGESYRKARGKLYGTDTSSRHGKDWGDEYVEIQQFYTLLNYLKRQGLVRKEGEKGKRHTRWSITASGKKKLSNIDAKEAYVAEKDKTLCIVAFDVPESCKSKREWLRSVLREMGFSLLQDSVWIGARKIPEQFVHDLKERDLIPHVHIFSIHREGSIELIEE
ncbi:MAG: hypothetical protein V1656_00300 [Candidatus Jorgensenbacteria bacterium]